MINQATLPNREKVNSTPSVETSVEKIPNRPEAIGAVMNIINQNTTTGNLDLINIVYGLMDYSLQATPAEIYYAILRKTGGVGIIKLQHKNGTTGRGIDLSSTASHESRINTLSIILEAAKRSSGCTFEVVPNYNIQESQESQTTTTPSLPEEEKRFETFVLTTKSKERGEIKWKIDVNVSQTFVFIDVDGPRVFVVVEIENDKGDKWVQSFYKSTGKNSGNAGTWFPNQGAYGEGWNEHISKEKYNNKIAADELQDGSKNPLTRMGSLEFVLNNGPIFKDISNKLTSLNLSSSRRVEYANINAELIKINPGVDIDSVHTREVAEKFGFFNP